MGVFSKSTSLIIGPLMTRKVVTVEMDDSLLQIREIFNHVKFHHLLVVYGRKLVGVISDRDLLGAIPTSSLSTLSEKERDTISLNTRAHQIMSRKLITIDVETSIEKASNLLL
jgi:acetoin utilization protein AcuB